MSNIEIGGVVMAKVEWGILFAIILNIATLGYAAGVLQQQVNDQGRRLSIVEAKADISTERLARIDANVTQLLEAARESRQR